MKPQSLMLVLTYSLTILCGYALATKVVEYHVSRASFDVNDRSLSKRTSVIESVLNAGSLYSITVEVGTPPQLVMLECTVDRKQCVDQNASTSITYVTVGGFNIDYTDGTNATGNYIKDTIAFGEDSNFTMSLQTGLVKETTLTSGVLGIGYTDNEATVAEYPNLIDQLVTHNFMNTKLYSLWHSSKDSEFGSILFGGIDRAKYYGTLKSMPIYPDISGNYSVFAVGLTSVSYSGTPASLTDVPKTFTNSSFLTPVILEFSTALIYLPVQLTQDIYDYLGVYSDDTNSIAVINCVFVNPSVISFTFYSGIVVNVSSTELTYDLPEGYNPAVSFDAKCGFGIRPATGGTISVLGDYFLRSAYVVYDLSNNLIAVAQSNPNGTDSDVVEVQPGATDIPEEIGQPFPSSDVIGGSSTPTSTSTSPTSISPATSTSSLAPLSTTKKSTAIAINVGISVPIKILITTLFAISL